MNLTFRPVIYAHLCLAIAAHAQLIRQTNTTLVLPANLPVATGYGTENALGSLTFNAPMATANVPGETDRLFVAQRGGLIQVVTNLGSTPAQATYFSLGSVLTAGQSLRNDGENGLLSLVIHPNFATNGTFFVYFSIQVDGLLYQRLHQVSVTNPAASTATLFSHKPLLTILDRETNHNGGDLHFGADGFLYLSLGDEGGGGDNQNNARFINHRLDGDVQRTGFWGQLLRLAVEIDPKTQPGVFPPNTVAPNPHVQNSTSFASALHGNYRVPADNPFHGYTLWHSAPIDQATVRTEIYATGLRNPFRWSFDPPTGRIFIGDVGQGDYEEIDLVAKGDDLGWSWREGFNAYPSLPPSAPGAPNPGDPPGTGFLPRDPIYEYDHNGSGGGNDSVVYGPNVTGGMVYRGSRLTELYGAYIFADYGTGFIAALREQTDGEWTGQRLATDSDIVDFGTDPRNNDLLFCDLNEGTVKRLVRTGTTGPNPPPFLSQTGAFSNLAALTPNAGIVPYAPNVDFWSDHATKSRWFAIQNDTDTVGFSADGHWTLPTGMIWIKHFEIEITRGNPATRRRLETRFLVKTATEIYGITYKWRDDQEDAELVPENGLTELIPASSPSQVWRYPSRSECRACHTNVGGFALSFNTRQLNRPHDYGAETQNQIAALSSAGYFSAPVSGVQALPAFAPLGDTSKSREFRVRSYLAVNCVQCHQPGGPATGNWDARPTTTTDAAGLINGLLANAGTDSANRWAVPGDLAHSVVLKRLQGFGGFARMPPLATNELDSAAIQVLSDWITLDLPGRQSFSQWQTANFGSSANPNAAPSADPERDGQTNAFEFLARTSPLSPQGSWAFDLKNIGNDFEISFPQPANRAVLIETSFDLQSWMPWDAAGNQPLFFDTAQVRTLIGPVLAPQQFFRARLLEQ
jgi:glucose/arabinose dehydrogenase